MQVIALGRSNTTRQELEVSGEGRVATAQLSGSVEGGLEDIKDSRRGGGRCFSFEVSPPFVVDGPGQMVPCITAALTYDIA